MAQASSRKLIVCGGNGFLGSRICKSAVSRGWKVTSISRSGEPNWSTVSSSPVAPSWSSSVTWHKADILQPSTYQETLKDADAVVHSMGILLEADYKGILQGKEPLMSGVQKMFSSSRFGASKNPLDEAPGEEAKPSEKEGSQLTYELMNRDSGTQKSICYAMKVANGIAILLAREANAQNVHTFIYISAVAAPPMVPGRYISTKRAAESTISKHFPDMRSVFLRPGLMYDSSRTMTMPLAAATRVSSTVNGLAGGLFTPLMGAGGFKPLAADAVADAAVESADDINVNGPIEVNGIEELAQRAWRKGML